MSTLAAALRSSVGKKYLMGFTGLVWFGFTIGHVIGNYLLFSGREAFNGYAYFLEHVGHGKLIYVAEVFLLLTLMIHVVNGVTVAWFDKQAARPSRYEVSGDAGGKSRKTIASQTMIFSGITLLAFIIFHIYSFKFGQKEMISAAGYTEQIADLYGLVVKRFADPVYTGFYVFVMLLLGGHLSHGIWSALQSLGLLNRRTLPVVAGSAGLVAFALAGAFLVLPITIFLMNVKFSTGNGGLF